MSQLNWLDHMCTEHVHTQQRYDACNDFIKYIRDGNDEAQHRAKDMILKFRRQHMYHNTHLRKHRRITDDPREFVWQWIGSQKTILAIKSIHEGHWVFTCGPYANPPPQVHVLRSGKQVVSLPCTLVTNREWHIRARDQPCGVDIISNDALMHIFSFLEDPNDLFHCREVNRRFRHVASRDALWIPKLKILQPYVRMWSTVFPPLSLVGTPLYTQFAQLTVRVKTPWLPASGKLDPALGQRFGKFMIKRANQWYMFWLLSFASSTHVDPNSTNVHCIVDELIPTTNDKGKFYFRRFCGLRDNRCVRKKTQAKLLVCTTPDSPVPKQILYITPRYEPRMLNPKHKDGLNHQKCGSRLIVYIRDKIHQMYMQEKNKINV